MKNLIVLALCFCFLSALSAQSNYFLKLDGIDGESLDKDHKGWSDISAFTSSFHLPDRGSAGSSRRRGAAILEDISCVKELDKSSPKIQEALIMGKVIPKVEIHLTSSSNGMSQTYYSYELKNVMITSYNISGQSDVGLPMDEFSLSYEEIKVTYTEYDSNGRKKGNVEYTWKVEKGEK